MYWFSWAVTFAVELSVVGQVIFFWTEKVPILAWISIFWVLLTTFNMFPVRYYGEIEFWIAFTKVLSIIGFIIFCICMVCGAGPYGPFGFRYWKNPGAWGPGIISSKKNEARFLGWVSSLINAAFTYQGTELIGVTAGEAANPRKTVPKAINKVIFRILIFYILSLFLIGLLVPYNDSKLTSITTYVSQSPFIISIQNSGIPFLDSLFNGAILITIISAGNSNVYVGSRILYGLAKNGSAPKFFKKTTKTGVPYVSVLTTSMFGSLAYLELSTNGGTVFEWLLNIVSIAGFFAWLLISVAHVRFMKVLQYRGISRDDLPYKAKLMPWLAYYAIFFIIVIIITQGFTSFTPHFNTVEFVASYISVFLFISIWSIFQIWKRCRVIYKIRDIDIETDRESIDNMKWEEEDQQNILKKIWSFIF